MSSTVPGTLGRFDTYLWNGQVLILPSLHRLPECSVSSRFLDLMPSSLGAEFCMKDGYICRSSKSLFT